MLKNIVLFAVASIALAGCGVVGSKSADSPVGLYKGDMEFRANAGKMDMVGTLKLDADGYYWYSLDVLAIMNEVGTYSVEGNVLTLTPEIPETDEDSGDKKGLGFQGAMQSAKKPHTMTIDSGYLTVTINDGPMSGELQRVEE